ncbi:MAG: LbtU family siderophore porin [Desulfobacteraceae bacterium]|nr:LbtU family siderophore porin [Desulfobacteraceae bacterium]
MKKVNFGIGLIITVTVFFMGTLPGFCASNVALEERIEKLEQKEGVFTSDSPLGQISEWVTISGAIEIEAGFASHDDADDTDESDISLATAELGIEAKPQDWVTGFMLFSWDDEEDKVTVDEAHVTLGGIDNIPFYLSAGKIYVPFGAFETMMISDPITLDMAEIADNGVQVGIAVKGFRAAAYVYNGDVDEANEDDTIQNFGFSGGYAMETDQFSFDLGADLTNNILESGVLSGSVDGVGLDEYVSGFALHAMFNWGPICLIGEYVSMIDDAEAIGGTVAAEELSAYALEAGYTFDVSGFETTVAIGYQASDTDDAGAYEDYPESKILGSVGVGITDNLSIACEYSTAENYSTAEGGDGDEIDTFTIQMAFEF